MITASADLGPLMAALTARARQLAEARISDRRMAKRGDPGRWRDASLLWPLFAKG
jgi:hypothetical protein